jgi:hypothetical protein
MYKLCIFLCLFCGSVALAQVNEQGYTKTGYSIGKVQIKPQSVLSAYTYDPVTDRYILIQLMVFH